MTWVAGAASEFGSLGPHKAVQHFVQLSPDLLQLTCAGRGCGVLLGRPHFSQTGFLGVGWRWDREKQSTRDQLQQSKY